MEGAIEDSMETLDRFSPHDLSLTTMDKMNLNTNDSLTITRQDEIDEIKKMNDIVYNYEEKLDRIDWDALTAMNPYPSFMHGNILRVHHYPEENLPHLEEDLEEKGNDKYLRLTSIIGVGLALMFGKSIKLF